MDANPIESFPRAEAWSLIAGQIGRGAIIAAVVLFLLAVVLGFVPNKSLSSRGRDLAFVFGCVATFIAFGTLATLFVKEQFQYETVASHTEKGLELKYRFAAMWSAQEGSFLLWACGSAIFGLLALRSTGEYRRWYVATISIFLASVAGILIYDSPFKIIPESVVNGVVHMPLTGNGLTPSLQNYWMVIHPPVIFLGFGSLVVPFAFAVAAMLQGDVSSYVARVRPWPLVTIAVLGAGICMGGLWAYETQGWGGFWAWDPVENASFVPWLFVATLLHGYIVQVTRNKWRFSNLVLSGLPFITFTYGTFLTRTGLLDKVSNHSFASMDKSGAKILSFFLLAIVLAYAGLLAFRGWKLAKADGEVVSDDGGTSRENLYRFGMLMMSLLTIVIAVGMSWPVLTDLFGSRMAKVEEPLYHKVVGWFFVPVMLLMAITPFASWRDLGWKALLNKVMNALAITIGLLGCILLVVKNPSIGVQPDTSVTIPVLGAAIPLLPWMMFLLFLCLFSVIANTIRVLDLAKRSPFGTGAFVAHVGLAVLMGGLILSRGFERKESVFVQEGVPTRALEYVINYQGITGDDLMSRDTKAKFELIGPNNEKLDFRPGLYYFMEGNEQKPMVWPHIERHLSHDLYFSLHPPIMSAWESPQMIATGESKTKDEFTIKNNGVKMIGQPGMAGTRFVASLDVQASLHDPDSGDPKARKIFTYHAEPELKMAEGGGLEPTMAPIGKDFLVALTRLDVASKAAEVQVMLRKPLFPVDLFYKPMTLLVWIGAGIMTLGGFMSAFARRFRAAKTAIEGGQAGSTGKTAPIPPDHPIKTEHAPLPTS